MTAAAVAAAPLSAQLVIDRTPKIELPEIEPEEEKEEEPQPVQLVYEGQPLQLQFECLQENFPGAGVHCSPETPCELFLELTSIASAGEKVFLAGDIHTSSAAISTVLLASEDGGTTWTEAAGRILSAGLERLQFADEKHGWAAGHEWQLDDSLRPFFLVTSNGGKTWLRHDIWDETDRTGALLDYYFDSPKHGYVIVERTAAADPFELYESLNGGRSWIIREISSDRPRLRNVPVAAEQPSWRFRENRESGSYEIQQLADGSWWKRAEFAPQAGVCRSLKTASSSVTAAPPQ